MRDTVRTQRTPAGQSSRPTLDAMDQNLHSPQRRLIELRMEHADLDDLIDRQPEDRPVDELSLRRMKKRRLALRDLIERLERMTQPQEPA